MTPAARRKPVKLGRAMNQLSDEQVARIRKIEDYHSTGSVFTPPTHAFEQIKDHEPSISRVMNPEDATRFVTDRERIHKSAQRHIRAHAH